MTVAPVIIDFESRSRADLGRVGGRNYWAHPSTAALCCAWHDTRDGSRGVWVPGRPWPHHGRTLAAHNADGFDRFGATRLGWRVAGWVDTSALARRAGLPGALDALGTRWLGIPKDDAGSRLTRSLSSVRRPREIDASAWRDMNAEDKRDRGALPPLDPDTLLRVVEYCESDVAIVAGAWPRLAAWLDVDAAALGVDRAVNDRGVAFDRDLASALGRAEARQAERAIARAAAELGWSCERVREVAMSPAQASAELGTDDARRATLASVEHPIADARRAIASIVAGKLASGLARVSPDGRIRDAHRYYGAHTGRWSQRGMQMHNLPRPSGAWTDDDIARAVDDCLAGRDLPDGAAAVLLRATLAAPAGQWLAVCDYSGVEARALAMVADDRPALDTFAAGRDPYKVAAATIFGASYETITKQQRQVGKIAELALGYGMGAGKFADTAAEAGADLDAMGVDARIVVATWRRAHAATVRFWHSLEAAWRGAVGGRDSVVRWPGGAIEVACDRADGVGVLLPSGRWVVYPEPAIGADGGLSYLGTRGTREHTYGGKLAENVIQALCRDLMADALVRAHRAGLDPVLHVHDEIVCEVAGVDGLDALRAIMLDVPRWARGFPVGAEGFVSRRYRK